MNVVCVTYAYVQMDSRSSELYIYIYNMLSNGYYVINTYNNGIVENVTHLDVLITECSSII